MKNLPYPPTPTSDQKDNYHGVWIADPYRWLEENNSPKTQAWIAAQNSLTFDFLAEIPARDIIHRRLTELWNYPRQNTPIKRNGRYFQLRNSGLQNQDVLSVRDGLYDPARLLLNPNTLSADGTIALTSWMPSPDGQWLAYATSGSGSDWLTWRVRDVNTGHDLPDLLEWSKFSGAAWRPDNSGFYYTRYAAPPPGTDYLGTNYDQKLYFHRLHTPQSEDTLVYERPDHKEWGFWAEESENGRFLILHISHGTDNRNRLFYQDLHNGGPMVELIPGLEAAYRFVGSDDTTFYLFTDLDAPRGRLIAVDTAQPDKNQWQTLIPESPNTMSDVQMANDEFITLYLHHAHHQLHRFDRQGRPLGHIPLPTLGSITTLSCHRSHNEFFYDFSSFLCPTTLYRYDFQQNSSEAIFAPPLPFDVSPYLTRQVFVTSKDGTQLPMFLTHRRDLNLNGQNPTLLYGYGGFNISLVPTFAVSYLVWLEMGGVLAWANLRGGGEYGEAWHQAGMLGNKQNVFDDFIACAEYLIAEKITSTPKLAITGRSNGGLLVGACLTQRPDLFGAAIPGVGVMDMLRFHHFTIGWAWVSDYGSPDDPEQFQTLYAYSPLHNLRPAAYPPTLVTTGDHDDRVVPGHSFKFAAALQAAQTGDAPILIRVQTKAGHGFGKPTEILIQETADNWAFLVTALKIYE